MLALARLHDLKEMASRDGPDSERYDFEQLQENRAGYLGCRIQVVTSWLLEQKRKRIFWSLGFLVWAKLILDRFRDAVLPDFLDFLLV